MVVPCAGGDVYAAQAGAVAAGSVVACAPDDAADAAAVRQRLADQPAVAVQSGYRGYRIAYRTERVPGVGGTGTARLWVPDTPTDGPRPVVVVTHGTVGLADRCAPSMGAPGPTVDDLGLPWLAAGYVTVLPDYAGLGNAGVQGYGNAPDTARSVLDAGRAARAAVTPGSVDDAMVVAGHSQGGGAALNAQSWSRRYAPDMPVVAAVAFAGSAQENVVLNAYRFPGLAPLIGGAGVTRAVVALATYADAANIAGEALAPLAFHPDVRDVVVDAIRDQCIFGIVATLATPNGGYQPPNTAAQLIDPDWIDDVVACDRRDVCTEAARAFVDRARANESVPDAQGAPVLMLSGEDDAQQPLDRQQCTADYLVANGLTPTTCAFAGEDHFTLVEAGSAHAVAWMRATLRGEAPPACPPGPGYPVCD
ncbi:MAG: hypothetical protein H6704_14190 [Myxococcales bacterium]|nr:hypothetical protein [Myxococcales bacterium]